jgi:hypothetical protein
MTYCFLLLSVTAVVLESAARLPNVSSAAHCRLLLLDPGVD